MSRYLFPRAARFSLYSVSILGCFSLVRGLEEVDCSGLKIVSGADELNCAFIDGA